MTTGLPGLIGLDHVGITVPDLDAAKAFYCDLLGGEWLYSGGPFDARELPRSEDGRDWGQAHLNVADARLLLHVVRLGAIKLELFCYERPADGLAHPPGNSDSGGHHIGIRVTDIHAAARYLRDHGVEVLEGPLVAPPQASSGAVKGWYFLDPWGRQLELIERD